MKRILVSLPVLGLAACAAPSEPTVIEALVGKQLVADGTVLVIGADGTVTGTTGDGEALQGTYTADATQVCSVMTAPPAFAGERCSVPVIDGNTVTFERSDGRTSPVYTIEG